MVVLHGGMLPKFQSKCIVKGNSGRWPRVIEALVTARHFSEKHEVTLVQEFRDNKAEVEFLFSHQASWRQQNNLSRFSVFFKPCHNVNS